MATPMATVKSVKRQTRREYGSGSVYQRKDGMWIGTYNAGWTSKGTRRRITVSAKSEAKCKARLREKIIEYKSGGVSTLSDRTTVKSYAEQWTERRVDEVRPQSYRADSSAIKQWIVPTIGHRRLGDLTAEDVRKVNRAQVDAGKAKSTRDRTHATLVKMLRDAVVDGARINAGVFAIKRDAGKKRKTRTAPSRLSMPLHDALRLLKVIEAEPDPSRYVAVILNGVRRGELLGLRWSRVDFENETLIIDRQIQELPYKDNKNKHLGFRLPDDYDAQQLEGRFHLVDTKTEAGLRVVPMTPWFRDALLAWRDEAPASPHDLVWCRDDGGPIDPVRFLADWKDLQRRAGISHPIRRVVGVDGSEVPDQYVLHEGRHTTVTMLKELGVKDEVIIQIVGQSKLVENYNHQDLLPEVRDALAQLEKRLMLSA